MAAAMSTKCITCPPSSFPSGFVCAGRTISVISDRDALTGFPASLGSSPSCILVFRFIPFSISLSGASSVSSSPRDDFPDFPLRAPLRSAQALSRSGNLSVPFLPLCVLCALGGLCVNSSCFFVFELSTVNLAFPLLSRPPYNTRPPNDRTKENPPSDARRICRQETRRRLLPLRPRPGVHERRRPLCRRPAFSRSPRTQRRLHPRLSHLRPTPGPRAAHRRSKAGACKRHRRRRQKGQ